MNETREERLNEIKRRLKEAFNAISAELFDEKTEVQIFLRPMYLKSEKYGDIEKSQSIFFKIKDDCCFVEVHALKAAYGLLKINLDKDIDSVNMCYAIIVGASKYFFEDAFGTCDYKSVVDWVKGTSTNYVFEKIKTFSKDFLKK